MDSLKEIRPRKQNRNNWESLQLSFCSIASRTVRPGCSDSGPRPWVWVFFPFEILHSAFRGGVLLCAAVWMKLRCASSPMWDLAHGHQTTG